MNYFKKFANFDSILGIPRTLLLAYSCMLTITLGALYNSSAMEDFFQEYPLSDDQEYLLFDGIDALDDTTPLPDWQPADFLADTPFPPASFNSGIGTIQPVMELAHSSQLQNPSIEPYPTQPILMPTSQEARGIMPESAQAPDQSIQPGNPKLSISKAKNIQNVDYRCLKCSYVGTSPASLTMHTSIHNPAPSKCPVTARLMAGGEDCSVECKTACAWRQHFVEKHAEIRPKIKLKMSLNQFYLQMHNTALKEPSNAHALNAEALKSILEGDATQIASKSAPLGKRKRSSLHATGIEKTTLNCSECGKSFTYNSQLEQHISIHNPVRSICPMGLPCEYEGATLAAWIMHFGEAHRQYLRSSRTTAMELARKTPCGVLATQKTREALSAQQSAAESASITQLPEQVDSISTNPLVPSDTPREEFGHTNDLIAFLTELEEIPDKNISHTDAEPPQPDHPLPLLP